MKPTNDDQDIFDAVKCMNIDSEKYPFLYRWLYSMNDYNNTNNL